MIGRIAITGITALLFYFLLPRLVEWIEGKRTAKLVAHLREQTGSKEGLCTDYSDGFMHFKPYSAKKADEGILVPLAKSRLFTVTEHDGLQRLRLKHLRFLRTGTPVLHIPGEKSMRAVCIFHAEKVSGAIKDRVKKLPKDIDYPVATISLHDYSVWFTALGIFCETLLFIRFLDYAESVFPALSAFVLIAGRLLPWFPPGLVLALLARSLEEKRRNASAALFLRITGILINAAVLFFGILAGGFALS